MNSPRACALPWLCGLLLAVACSRSAPAPSVVDAGTSAEVEGTAADGIHPVLQDVGPPDPRAARLCRALQGLVAERKATCCSEPSSTGNVEATCASTVSALLKAGDAAIDEGRLTACEAAQSAALSGCGWVRPLAPDVPEGCRGLIAGRLDDGARCRSSLECKEGLRCHGASAIDTGRCGKPRPENAPCGAGLDALALALGTTDIDAGHAECQGFCALGRCKTKPKAGAPCSSPMDCGPGNRCEAGGCREGLVALGARCSGQVCVDGGRCVAGRCAALAAEGGACMNDFDCAQGGCVRPDGAPISAPGTCGMKCRSWRDVNTHER